VKIFFGRGTLGEAIIPLCRDVFDIPVPVYISIHKFGKVRVDLV